MRRGGGSWSASGGPYFEMFSITILKKVCFVGSGLLNSSLPPPPLNRWTKLEWGFPSVSPLPSSLQPLTLLLTAVGGVTSQQESPPKTNSLNPCCVSVPGPGLEPGKARLVVEPGTSDPANPYPQLWGTLWQGWGIPGGGCQETSGSRCQRDDG